MQMVYHLKTNKYLKIVSFLLFLVCIRIYLLISQKYGIEVNCIFSEITGLYCPGCGITRMFISLFNLDIYQAFRYNPLVFIYLIFTTFYMCIQLFTKKYDRLFNNTKFLLVVLFITLIYGVMRNIEAFSYLLPTVIANLL